jgi:integrase/recombinase XerD
MKSELNKFLCYLHIEKGFSQGTIKAYQLDIERGLIPFLRRRGKSGIGEVTKDDIRAYMDFLTNVRNNSVVTRARKLAAIKSFFNYLVENEELGANPASSIKSPKIPEREPIYLSENECLRLLESIVRRASPKVRNRDMAIIILSLHVGLRVSELTNLKLVDVDLERAQIKITRKGNKEQYLHLNSETVNAMAQYLANRPTAGNGRCFVGTNGDNLDRTHVYSIVQKYLKLAGINKGKYGPHLLRHTFCTRLHLKGVSPFTIKDLAGHKSLNTTMRYIKIENREQAEAIDRLEFGLSYSDMKMP